MTLYRGLPGTGVYSWSPFVVKLEARLRFAGIPYRVDTGSLSAAPRGKVPYVSVPDGEKGSVLIGDSGVIIRKLVEGGWSRDLDDGLGGMERVRGMGIRALLEDKLYFLGMYEKWVLNYYTMRDTLLAAVPWPIRVLIGLRIYSKVKRTMQGQGTLLLSDEEIDESRRKIWETLNAALVESRSKYAGAEGPFWVSGGEAPTEVDAVLFGFIVSGLICYAAPETQKIIRSFPTLVDYARRIHERYFPDYALWE
ncbi:hypothetical protein BDV25DRAFT_167867 [Aspergillus avenaceus]|uniref:Thioredoxin-like fold domain-containing protein n=1 Tax=Aspergillus avenaceus TaxID=36643 RepID=A0A5N6TT05_ASPAV|nr:hypothetical protein BDV25DRAFT_167867 [Aspergillus avenaceus]